jgi:hypothetical protein
MFKKQPDVFKIMPDCPYLQVYLPRKRKSAIRFFCSAVLPKKSLKEKVIEATCREEEKWKKCPDYVAKETG